MSRPATWFRGAQNYERTSETRGIDKQAHTVWIGTETYKSGFNALLAYIDNPRPTKAIEVRNKLQFGDQATTIGVRVTFDNLTGVSVTVNAYAVCAAP